MRSKFQVVTIGGAVQDITFYTSAGKVIATPQNLTAQRLLAFEYGAKISTREVYFGFGGGAANVAVGLSRLGRKTAVVCRVGNDELGSETLKNFLRQKVDRRSVQRDRQTRTGVSCIISADRQDREHTIFLYRSANEQLNLTSASVPPANWYYLASLSGSHWFQNIGAAFAAKHKHAAQLAWNPGTTQLAAGRLLLVPFLRQTDVLIMNKDEAIELVLSGITLGRRNPRVLNRPVYLLNILQEWGPKVVVITQGKQGAWAYDGKKIYHQKNVRSKVVDTCGVGDSFSAGLLAGLMESRGEVGRALRWGALNAGANASAEGAQNGLLTRREMIARL